MAGEEFMSKIVKAKQKESYVSGNPTDPVLHLSKTTVSEHGHHCESSRSLYV
jgi:DNA-binding GntR family transcriptional regulator